MTTENSKNNKLVIVLLSVIFVLVGILLFTQVKNSGFLSSIFGGKVVTVPIGSQLRVTLASSVSSGLNRAGDSIVGNVINPIIIGEDTAIPAGSQITGSVVSIAPAERSGKGGFISIRFNSIQTPNGKNYSISTPTIPFYAGGSSRLAMGVTKTILGAATGAALGTAIGAIAGGKRSVGRGAWSGAAIGGGIGATSALVSRGQEVVVPSGRQLTVTLEQPVQIVAQKK